MTPNDRKIEIIKSIKIELLQMQAQTKLSISNAQAEANYHIGAMQSRYDTFKEEAQYLVAAQQIRLINIERDLYLCDEIIYKISKKKYLRE